ncbi:Hsp20/alpha crystallin family protein [Actinoplanes xinjiangensis]|uniref:HSP20 family protein n=1 Tax=Actinoplanes xinjiangensis TaxID=512350 RepID=A0A316FT23_9ACTN|nr:Hsp20/alpha crystallin family protein [Actinoplanes xinjiangensis]PWK51503.1 HSP20 family protein [Actinoplanes xinjiangensis]GIF35862.1 hypothetical protein Axi01nite_01730 [Actinoplanes xinjiangensis]
MLTTLTARVLEGSDRGSGARLDAYRVDGTFHIDIALPGADTASIDITADGGALTVRAARRRPGPETPPAVVTEHPAGTLVREVPLAGRFDTDRLDARYDDGVLTLSIPALEGTPRRTGAAV